MLRLLMIGLILCSAPEPDARAQRLLGALPALESWRLTAFQARAERAFQIKMHRAHPSRIGDVEQILLTHRMCFREVARREVTARYLRIAEQLSDQELGRVVEYLKRPGAEQLLAFEEGASARLALPAAQMTALLAADPAVDRFLRLVSASLKRNLDNGRSTPACYSEMRTTFEQGGVPIPASP